ncbi:MAG: transcription-repair coupling factor [Clostridiales bacterium]|nr:transcription-repair coupling factor [Clostridiales bacterium]
MDKKVKDILDLIAEDKELIKTRQICSEEKIPLNITGLCEQQKSYIASALSSMEGKKPVIVVPDFPAARELSTALSAFTDDEIIILRPSEMSLVSAVASSRDNDFDRTGTIERIIRSDFGAAIICAGALVNRLMPGKDFKSKAIVLKLGHTMEIPDLTTRLLDLGYERTGSVSSKGEFSARGDIVDIFPPDRTEPLRISFFDDEIDQIKTFDPDSQRSVDSVRRAEVYPACEVVVEKKDRAALAKKMQLSAADDINKMNASSERKTAEHLHRIASEDADLMREGMRISAIARWLPLIIEKPDNILDYVDRKKCDIYINELGECRQRMDGYLADYYARFKTQFETGGTPKCAFETPIKTSDLMAGIGKLKELTLLSCLKSASNGLAGGKTINVTGVSGENWRGRDDALAGEIKTSSNKVIFMLSGAQRTEAFRLRMMGEGASPVIVDRHFPSGFSYPAIGLELIGEHDVFGAEKKLSKKKKNTAGRISFFGDINPGDYVVHDAHGIGQYEGIVNMRMGKSNQDYLKINYAKNAVIYVPVDKLDKLQKYVGPNGSAPKLSSLDSGEWTRSVERARTSIKKVAFDLVKLYAARRASKGYSCGPDDAWQKEFEENFPFVETEDQLTAIRDIKKDMESDIPMDRLLCGDVGFGKTEVAFRAIFKCVTNGRQAFMLAPTTLLAQQHYDNFVARVGSFPIRTALLSRFVTPAKLKQSLEDIKNGNVDVVIGTHRILSKDVIPHKLGLLVVDEEQRFGVNHKEQIKAMRANIDVLTLTATPIPRTLHMSMTGIRDISVLDEAPMNRRPVQTYVLGYDEEVIVQACLREISRGGQVFYLYNKTADIDKKADRLSELMPGARVVYAHGKMSEHQMEKIIESFILGESDILVCTTIIESGVDMPNVNTMIVEDSDRFGLSQLYQIKGRVGRSDRQAYAYITYNDEKEMNSDARKRLMAIREFTELGSGVKVALRDLEVRGAGNLLGAEQHGQMDVIGYELYCRLLDEEIRNLREDGDTTYLPKLSVNLEIDFDSYIPSRYIDDEALRMAAYRRIGNITNTKERDDFLDEVTDRYGDPPREVLFLAGAALIKSMAADAGFERVCFKETGILLYFAGDRKLDMPALSRLVGDPDFAGRIMMNAQGKPYLHYKPRSNRHDMTVEEVTKLLTILIENKS